MRLENLLTGLSKHLKLGTIELNPDGITRFELDQELLLTIEKINQTNFLIYAPLGISPGKQRNLLDIYTRCLEGNLFYFETSSGAIGLDKKTDNLVFFREFSEESFEGQNEFNTAFDHTLETLRYWRAEFATCLQGEHNKVYSTNDPHLGISSHKDMQIIMP